MSRSLRSLANYHVTRVHILHLFNNNWCISLMPHLLHLFLMKLAPITSHSKVISCPFSPLPHATQQQLEGHKYHLNQVCPGHHHKIFWINHLNQNCEHSNETTYTTTWDLLDSVYTEDFVKNKHLPVILASQVGMSQLVWSQLGQDLQLASQSSKPECFIHMVIITLRT